MVKDEQRRLLRAVVRHWESGGEAAFAAATGLRHRWRERLGRWGDQRRGEVIESRDPVRLALIALEGWWYGIEGPAVAAEDAVELCRRANAGDPRLAARRARQRVVSEVASRGGWTVGEARADGDRVVLDASGEPALLVLRYGDDARADCIAQMVGAAPELYGLARELLELPARAGSAGWLGRLRSVLARAGMLHRESR